MATLKYADREAARKAVKESSYRKRICGRELVLEFPVEFNRKHSQKLIVSGIPTFIEPAEIYREFSHFGIVVGLFNSSFDSPVEVFYAHWTEAEKAKKALSGQKFPSALHFRNILHVIHVDPSSRNPAVNTFSTSISASVSTGIFTRKSANAHVGVAPTSSSSSTTSNFIGSPTGTFAGNPTSGFTRNLTASFIGNPTSVLARPHSNSDYGHYANTRYHRQGDPANIPLRHPQRHPSNIPMKRPSKDHETEYFGTRGSLPQPYAPYTRLDLRSYPRPRSPAYLNEYPKPIPYQRPNNDAAPSLKDKNVLTTGKYIPFSMLQSPPTQSASPSRPPQLRQQPIRHLVKILQSIENTKTPAPSVPPVRNCSFTRSLYHHHDANWQPYSTTSHASSHQTYLPYHKYKHQ